MDNGFIIQSDIDVNGKEGVVIKNLYPGSTVTNGKDVILDFSDYIQNSIAGEVTVSLADDGKATVSYANTDEVVTVDGVKEVIGAKVVQLDDHGDIIADATKITTDDLIDGKMEQEDDLDYFAIDLQAGKSYKFGVEFFGSSDFDFSIRDKDDNVLKTINSSYNVGVGGGPQHEELEFIPTEDATYYISTVSHSGIGEYQFFTQEYVGRRITDGCRRRSVGKSSFRSISSSI